MTAIATRPLYDSTDSLLRFAMRADATVTGFLGLAIAAAADPLSSLTGFTPAQAYTVGVFCVLYGAAVFGAAALPNLRRAGIDVVIANVVCTLAALAVVATGALGLTGAGTAGLLACGVYTACFGLLQYLGVRRLTGWS